MPGSRDDSGPARVSVEAVMLEASRLNASTQARIESVAKEVQAAWKGPVDKTLEYNIRGSLINVITEYTSSGFQQMNKMLQLASLNRLDRDEFRYYTYVSVAILTYLVTGNTYETPFSVWRWNADNVTASIEKSSKEAAVSALNKQAVRDELRTFLKEPGTVDQLIARLREYVESNPFDNSVDAKNKRIENGLALKNMIKDEKGTFAKALEVYEANKRLLKSRSSFSDVWGQFQARASEAGNTLRIAPFTSTSLVRSLVEKSNTGARSDLSRIKNCCLIQIEVPAKTPCLYIEGNGERELLLPPCTQFIVLPQILRPGGSNIIRLRAIGTNAVMPSIQDMVRFIQLSLRSARVLAPELTYTEEESLNSEFLARARQERCRVADRVGGTGGHESKRGGAGGSRVVSERSLVAAARTASIARGVQVLTNRIGPNELRLLERFDNVVLTSPPTMPNPREWMAAGPWKVRFLRDPKLFLRGTVIVQPPSPFVDPIKPRVTPVALSLSVPSQQVVITPVPSAPTQTDMVLVLKQGPFMPNMMPTMPTSTYLDLNSSVPSPLVAVFSDAVKAVVGISTPYTIKTLTATWNRGIQAETVAFRSGNAGVILLGADAVDWPTELSNVPSQMLAQIETTASTLASSNASFSLIDLNAKLKAQSIPDDDA